MQKTEIEPHTFFKRITLTLLLLFCMTVFGHAQQVTFSGTNMPLRQVFAAIKKQTGYLLIVRENDLEKTHPVTASVTNMPLPTFLDQIMKDQPLRFGIKGKTIYLTLKEATPPPVVPEHDPHKGRVTDTDGRPVPGVTILLKEGKTTAITDEKGNYTINAVNGDVLVFSAIGFERKFVTLQPNTPFVTALQKAESKLDEIQIIAYGQTSSRLSTGNISTVKAKDIEKSPVSNPLLALAGRTPGVFITQATGYAGTGVQVQVQGQNSIANGTVPFYVVDGVPYIQAMPTPLASIQGTSNSPVGGGISNPMAFINPQDIESIDILKDADATAIYGSRAANGAILITTKKGKTGTTSTTLNIQQGLGQVSRKLNTLNTDQYLNMRRAAYTAQGLAIPTTPSSTNYDLTVWDQDRYTDWQKALIGGTASYTDAQASISGGNITTQVMFGANYHRETLVTPGNFADNRGAVHFAINQASLDQRFKAVFSGNYLVDDNHLPSVDLTSFAMKMAPNAPALYDATGALNWEKLPNGTETWYNPLRALTRPYNVKSNNLVSNLELGYRIWSTLNFKTSFGYTRLESDEMLLTPQAYFPPSTTSNSRSAFFSDRENTNWSIEPQLTYVLVKDYGKFDFLAGTTFQKNKYNLQAIAGGGYSNDGQLENITAATTVSPTNASRETYNYNAVFGRMSYNYQDKYLLNFSIRRDGSSRFGSDNLFHNFYGGGVAWVFTKEEWLGSRLPFLSFGKLKASYGTTGNDQIGNYAFMSLYRSYGLTVPYGGGTTLRASGLNNPYLQWEQTSKFNAGIDLGFINDRIIINLNYYINRSSNQLLNYGLPIMTGFSSITRNFDAVVQNKGAEITVNTQNIRKKDFSWNTGFNISIPRNKLVKFPGLATSTYANTLIVGQPLAIQKAFKYAGVNPETGRYNFEKANGTIAEVPTLVTDQTQLIDKTARFYGGLTNSITYKGFTLDFLFQFVKQKGYDETKYGFTSPGSFSATSGTGNQPVSALQYWQQKGDNTPLQLLNPNVSAITTIYTYASSYLSSSTWTDASYIRLKNLSLSYALPGSLIKKMHLKQTRVFAQGQNLLTFTKYKGLDPENMSSFVLPPLRVITFGAQLTL